MESLKPSPNSEEEKKKKKWPPAGLLAEECGYSTFNEQEKAYYHAYQYAWRRHYLKNFEPSYPADPQGEYFNAELVDRAHRALYPQLNRHQRRARERERITPADQAAARGEYETAARYRAQDRARAEAKARIIGDGRKEDGTPSPEALAYVDLCMAQVRANLGRWRTRNKQAVNIDEVLASLGVTAKEVEP